MACKNGCCSTQEHSHSHNHDHSPQSFTKEIILASFSFVLLMAGIVISHFQLSFFKHTLLQIIWYGVPLGIVGFPVFYEAFLLIRKKDFFNELTLMSFAVIGAWIIGEYAEGLGVMVFYTFGEIAQSIAVSKSRSNIKSLLDIRPDTAHLVQGSNIITKHPEEIHIGDIIEVYTGEKVPLDGILISDKAFFNTSALTGESLPRKIESNEEVLAGMIVSDKTVRIQVTKEYKDSTLSRILQMVEDASENKSPTEQFIRKFARVYTPIVFCLATSLVIIPFFILGQNYNLTTWFYRSLVFLVLSCPCALVISIPLGYFGGIGLASKNGILFKGSNHLEAMTHLKTLFTDKTGTMTHGVFAIQQVISEQEENMLCYLSSLESHSTHPIAKAIVEYTKEKNISPLAFTNVTEVAGMGIIGTYENKDYLAGNKKLMEQYNINIPQDIFEHKDTIVFIACDKKYLGCVILSDKIKEDSFITIQHLHNMGVKVIMLSGDKTDIVESIAKKLNIDEAYGDLLPDEKAHHVQTIQQKNKDITAFVGDGINDAPVLALSDVGIAMGGLGSDLAIETADMIIQTDEPSKIPLAILIAKVTRSIVFQNIILAAGVKIIVLILGANGLASMWEAIFADVGVSLLATLNSSRLLYKNIKL